MMSIIGFLYSTIVVIAVFGYAPQLYKLWKSDSDGMDISVATWLIWLYTWIVSLFYGIIELEDIKFCIVAVINLVGHVGIIALTMRNRHRYKKTQESEE